MNIRNVERGLYAGGAKNFAEFLRREREQRAVGLGDGCCQSAVACEKELKLRGKSKDACTDNAEADIDISATYTDTSFSHMYNTLKERETCCGRQECCH